MPILRCMGSKFCVKFQRAPLKFHTKFWTHTPQSVHFTVFIFCVWVTISLNCDVISLSETGHRVPLEPGQIWRFMVDITRPHQRQTIIRFRTSKKTRATDARYFIVSYVRNFEKIMSCDKETRYLFRYKNGFSGYGISIIKINGRESVWSL